MDQALVKSLPLDPKNPGLVLRWKEEYSGWYTDEPSSFVHEIEGEVIEIAEEGEALAGRFAIIYLDIEGAISADFPLFDVADCLQTTTDYWAALLGDNGWPQQRVERVLAEPPLNLNLLILDRLELLPAYRGRGLGLEVLCEMIRRFSPGAGLVAMTPFPLQFALHAKDEPDPWRLALELPKCSKNTAVQRLRRHYARLGFVLVPRTQYMVRLTDDPLPRARAENS